MTLFLFAGSDTTSTWLSSTIYLLSQHPDKLRKLQQELDKHISLDEEPDIDLVMNKLLYLAATLKEVLRVRPSVTAVSRCAVENTTLPSGQRITTDVNLMIPIYVIHRNSEIWGDNADEFLPERWLDENGEITNKPHKKVDLPLSSVYIPFVSGARSCIGQSLAR